MFESFNCSYFSVKRSLFMHEYHVLDYGLENIFKSCFKILSANFNICTILVSPLISFSLVLGHILLLYMLDIINDTLKWT